MLRILLSLIIILFAAEVRAGWVDQQWTDYDGKNHKGTVSQLAWSDPKLPLLHLRLKFAYRFSDTAAES